MVDAGKKEVGEEGGFKMEVVSLEKNEEKASFILKDADASFANELRRIMIEEVPAMAIEDVEFRKNDSILYDEIIAHRLGLLPLTTDLKSYNLLSECKCNGEGCARCSVKLTLKAKGPCTVYASDLKSKDSAVKPAFPKTPIVKLIKNQELELEAKAVLGKGKEHMKFSPCLVYYKYKPNIEINDKCNDCGKCVESCPQHVFEMKGNKISINKDHLFNCHLCQACVDACPKDSIKLNEDENNFIFYIESWGQLSCKEIAVKASQIIQEKTEQFSELIKKAKQA